MTISYYVVVFYENVCGCRPRHWAVHGARMVARKTTADVVLCDVQVATDDDFSVVIS